MAAAAAVLVSSVIACALPAGARYQTVAGDLVQWEWSVVEQQGTFQVTDLVVRSDGWMIVSTGTYADGFLHLIPPWGGAIDEANRFGPEPLGLRQLELRKGRLYGLRQETQRQRERTHNPGVLVEVDATSGAAIRRLGEWWFQDLAVDPVSEDLVLQTSGQEREPYRHDLVRFDPDRGTIGLLVADSEPRSDRALEVAYSDDGQLLFTANVTDVPATIDVRRRDGALVHTLQSGQLDALVAGRTGTCFEGVLLLTRFDGSVWSIGTAPRSTPSPVATGGHSAVVSYAALDRDGHLATARFADVTLLACPGFVPPRSPAPVTAHPVAPVRDVPIAAAAPANGAGPPAAPAHPAPPPPAPTAAAAPPPPAPPAAPVPIAPPSALGGAVQSAGAPSAAAADSPDEEHTTSVAASSRSTLAVSLGAVVAMAFVAYSLAVPPPSPRPSRVRGFP
ncbi:MAG TPA: hypothetical protein VM143_07335 [Acidimicrobiales bacterium]|nr:hypothetical protein [Acidimicrobiales bacterium]